MPTSSSVVVSTGLLRGFWPHRSAPAEPADWAEPLSLLADLGDAEIEFSQFWGPLDHMTDAQMRALRGVLDDLGLSVSGVSLVGTNLHNDETGSTYDRVLRTIAQVALLGGSVVSLGPHPMRATPLTPSQAAPYPTVTDADVSAFAAPLRKLADFAATAQIALSLEMHEQTMLHSSRHVLRVLEATGAPNVGANPDLGNLIRATAPMAETYEETITALGGSINYWHVKNAMRVETGSGIYRAFPTPMPSGLIDYRAMLAVAFEAGFAGPLVIEHSAGDILHHARESVSYLRSLLADLTLSSAPGAQQCSHE